MERAESAVRLGRSGRRMGAFSRSFVRAVAVLGLFGTLLGSAEPTPETRLWLWAWERPEDLRFLASEERVGVAYLSRTLLVDREEVRVSPRRQPLRLPDTVPLIAVVRVEVPRGAPPSASTVWTVAATAAAALSGTRATGLQIDFDARASEIPYYRALLARLRELLPPEIRLGITALAAWCAGERSWLAGPLPTDEVVPMVFSMGPDTPLVRAWLEARGGFSVPACRGAVGVSLAEPLRPPPGTRSVYAFSATPWTEASYAKLHWRERR